MSEEQEKYGMEVVKFSVAEADIAKKKAIYMDLVVDGPKDDEGFQAVDTARKVMKSDRVAVDKREKELKANANIWRKRVGDRAKELRALIEPVENHLIEQCKIVTDEKKRIKEEKERLFKEKIDGRMEQLLEYGRNMAYQEVATMPDEEWEECIFNIIQEYNAEQEHIAEEKRLETERVARIEAENKAEAERLAAVQKAQDEAAAKVRDELEKKAAEQAKQQERVDAENAKIAAELAAKQAEIDAKEKEIQDEKDRIQRIAFEKKAKEAARIQAEADAKAAAEKAEAEKKALAEAEKAEAERIESLKSDRELSLDWIERAVGTPEFPSVTSELETILEQAQMDIESILEKATSDVKSFCDPHGMFTGGENGSKR